MENAIARRVAKLIQRFAEKMTFLKTVSVDVCCMLYAAFDTYCYLYCCHIYLLKRKQVFAKNLTFFKQKKIFRECIASAFSDLMR